MLNIIAVIGKNRELGKNNALLWHIPGELKRFKGLTYGHPVVMGRKTYESIGKTLPGRTNIVLTGTEQVIEGVTVVTSIAEAMAVAKKSDGSDEIFVIGGAKIYEQFINIADRLYLTLVDLAYPSADVFFPAYSAFGSVVSREDHLEETIPYTYITLQHPVLTPGVELI